MYACGCWMFVCSWWGGVSVALDAVNGASEPSIFCVVVWPDALMIAFDPMLDDPMLDGSLIMEVWSDLVFLTEFESVLVRRPLLRCAWVSVCGKVGMTYCNGEYRRGSLSGRPVQTNGSPDYRFRQKLLEFLTAETSFFTWTDFGGLNSLKFDRVTSKLLEFLTAETSFFTWTDFDGFFADRSQIGLHNKPPATQLPPTKSIAKNFAC